MRRRPAAGAQRPHADGGDFAGGRAAGIDPDARVLLDRRRSGQADVGQGLDHDLLQPVHVRRSRRRVVGYGHDRVGDQLARPVVGDVAAAVGPREHGPDAGGFDQDMAHVGVRAEGVGGRVLQHQQVVVVRLTRQGVLEHVGLVVGDRPERADAEHRAGP